MADEFEEDYEMTNWMGTVELRLGRLRLIGMVDGALAVGALALGVVTFKAMTNLAQSLAGIGEATTALMQVTFPNAVPVQVKETPVAGTDETLIPPPTDVAEPYEAPATELKEETRAMIANDPITPAELAKLDQLKADGQL
jgi:hypothetical protein